MERTIVRNFLYPALLDPPSGLNFSDQFAFRPTGSTTAAIISLLLKITNLLASEPYVIVLALDFSKAFDKVRHATLMTKMASLRLPDHVYNWLTDFFLNHSHCVKFNGVSSLPRAINASIVQGSAIGPASYVVYAADLQPVTAGNEILKYADDTYLIIPASNTNSRTVEIANVNLWSQVNNIQLNHSKSMEVIFRDPRRRTVINEPIKLNGINRVTSLPVLGITVSRSLAVTSHVDTVLQSCARDLYAIKLLRSHGMSNNDLCTVFRTVVIAKLTYASSAWVGFAPARDVQRIDAFLIRSHRAGLCQLSNFSDLCDSSDEKLFSKVCNNHEHILHQHLPDTSAASKNYNLRPRPHHFNLPFLPYDINTNSFINRMLYNDCY